MEKQHKTIQDLINVFSEYGEREAIVALGKKEIRKISFSELLHTVGTTAKGLARQGYEQHNPVALSGSNSPEWVFVALAVIYAGHTLLPIDPQADRETIAHIFQDSGAEILFTDRDLEKKFTDLDAPGPKKIFFLDKQEEENSWSRFNKGDSGESRHIELRDTAALFYTSGTTGPPKGVPLTHGNLASQPEAIKAAEIITADERVFLPLPLHHVYPFVVGMVTPLVLGVPVIFPYSLTGKEIIRGVDEGRATVMIGVPRLYRTLYEGIRKRIVSRGAAAGLVFDSMLAFSILLRRRFGFIAGRRLFSFVHKQFGNSLRILASGGSALDADLAEHLEGLGWRVAIGYGITETSPLLTIHPPGAGMLQSVGRAVQGVELKINPETGEADKDAAGSENRKTGEVLARGPNVFSGYHNLPEKTEEAFTENGWFCTGDLGHLDDEGFLYLHGRAKTLIITESGKNIQPDEVEKVYADHPAIQEIGVLGSEGRLVGVIVPDRKNIDEEEDSIENVIRDAVAEQSARLPDYKTLAEYVVSHESLARTRLGKIRRHLLEKKYSQLQSGENADDGQKGAVPIEEMSDHDRALLEDETARQVWEMLAERFGDRRLAPDSSPRFDLGIDSLEWLDLSLDIQQRTGVEMSEEVIGRIATIRDLLEEVGSLPQSQDTFDPRRVLREPESALDDEQKRWLQPLGKVLSAMAYLFYQVNRFLMKSWFRLKVTGSENLPAQAPFLITPNHLSLLDPFVIAAALPYDILRKSYYAGWRRIAFRNALFRFASRLAQAVPIDDQHAVSSSLAFSAAVLKQGSNLILFPEGKRSSDGSLQEFKIGVGLLLEYYDIPVVPVYIDGTFEALPKGAKFPNPQKVTVTFGKPLEKNDLLADSSHENARESITRSLRKEMKNLGGSSQP